MEEQKENISGKGDSMCKGRGIGKSSEGCRLRAEARFIRHGRPQEGI